MLWPTRIVVTISNTDWLLNTDAVDAKSYKPKDDGSPAGIDERLRLWNDRVLALARDIFGAKTTAHVGFLRHPGLLSSGLRQRGVILIIAKRQLARSCYAHCGVHGGQHRVPLEPLYRMTLPDLHAGLLFNTCWRRLGGGDVSNFCKTLRVTASMPTGRSSWSIWRPMLITQGKWAIRRRHTRPYVC